VASSTTALVSTTTDELVNKIEERNIQIKQLEQEIKQYTQEVDSASKEKVTLQSTIKTLDLTKKKISTDINLTDTKINKTVLTMEQLGNEIKKTKESIDTNKSAVINAIKETRLLEDRNMVEIILSNSNIGEIWSRIDYIRETRDIIRRRSKELALLNIEMEAKQSSLLGQKKILSNLKQDLNGKKQAARKNNIINTN
jgi:chromosome segregation ATPase